ncbi:MAG TPA: hypothetical protein VF186_00325 [Gaiellaceae bacterium]|jgi:hypothetical protein
MRRSRDLGGCHGFAVAAGEAAVGSIETPIFGGVSVDPDYLVVRTVDEIPGTFRVVSASVVEDVDPARRLMRLGLTYDQIVALPEHLPLEPHDGREREEDQ